MKSKTSISLSPKLLKLIDRLPGKPSRSEVIEEALVYFFKSKKASERDQSDLEILNAKADLLNAEARDVLDFQIRT